MEQASTSPTGGVALERGLFEVPPGVRVVDEPPHDDADLTRIMDFGDLEESEQLLAGFDPEALVRNTRPVSIHERDPTRSTFGFETVRAGRQIRRGRRRASRGRLAAVETAFAPGARFVYGVMLVTLNLGMLGLAASWQNTGVMLVTGIFAFASAVLLWVFWRSWLDGLPYVYRLLTSLGEDAENLLHWRLFRRGRVRSLYR